VALGTMNFGAAYLAAFDVDWRQEDEEVIDRLVARGSTAIAQFIDPAYPAEGRPLAGEAVGT